MHTYEGVGENRDGVTGDNCEVGPTWKSASRKRWGAMGMVHGDSRRNNTEASAVK